MPGYDGTGPTGSGPMSGGGRGVCRSKGRRSGFTDETNGQRGRMRWCRGSRFARSCGFGRFDGSGIRPVSMEPESHHERLEAEVNELRTVIDDLQHRLDNLS